MGSIFRSLREEASLAYAGPKRPLASRTVLFRATQTYDGTVMRIDRDLGWAHHLGANLTVVPTPGNRDTLLGAEYACHVADEIKRQIGHELERPKLDSALLR